MQRDDYLSEKELLSAIAAGNEGAFYHLYESYREKMFHFLLNITKSKEISEELLTDIFMKLWVGKDWIDSINNIESFLRKVSYNKAIDYLRYAARQEKLQKIIAGQMNFAVNDSPETLLMEKDYHRILAKAVEELTPQRKIIYRLSREQFLSHEEIAQKLNLSVNTVNNHIKAAVNFIKNYLNKNNMEGLVLLSIMLH